MSYDFQTVVERRGTDCLKFDSYARRGHAADDLPLWVADMDFPLPPEVVADLQERCAHGIFGYTEPGEPYYEAAIAWIARHEGWQPEREHFVHTPGVVFALAASVAAFTEPGEGVLVQQPVYYPFKEVIEDNGRRVVNAPLAYRGGAYTVDFDAFERIVREEHPRLFLLCNPHNPVGRVWTLEEIGRIAKICLEHDVIVVSDEIHADFARPGFAHTPFVSAGHEVAQHCVVCTSPGKSFNLAGLQVSNILIPNADLRRRFKKAVASFGYSQGNTLGFTACESCYTKGEAWFGELLGVIDENIRHMDAFLRAHCPKLHMVEPQSTYLTWVDCRELSLSDAELAAFVNESARLWLDMGDIFGPDGSGFLRFNVACPRATLDEALRRLQAAYDALAVSAG